VVLGGLGEKFCRRFQVEYRGREGYTFLGRQMVERRVTEEFLSKVVFY